MNKLKFGLIGCGRISYKQVEGLAANYENAILTAVSDIVEAKMTVVIDKYFNKSKENFNVNEYIDYKDMIEKEDLNSIIISTESGYHEEIALYCINKGINTIIEKPIALSIEGANKIVEAGKKNNVKVGVCHQNRFNRPIQALRNTLDNKKLGKIFNGTARILWTRDMGYYEQAPWRGTWEKDGGTLMNQCIHNIDLLNWMMDDEIDTVYAQIANFKRDIEAEDFGAILIRYKKGAVGIIEGTAVTYPKNLEETLSITGETGTVVIGGMAVNKIQTWNVKGDNSENFEGMDSGDKNSIYGHGHVLLFKDFIEAIRGDRKPLIDAQAGMNAMKIILAAYKSQKTGMAVKWDEFNEFNSTEMKDSKIKIR
jgi:predicted dehydrogenase